MFNISPYVFPGLKDIRTLDDKHTVSDAVNMICAWLRYDIAELITKSRKQDIVFRRSIVIKKLRDYHYTTTDIGKYFKKDHSTIIYNSTEVFRSICDNERHEHIDDMKDIEKFIICERKPKLKPKTKRYINATV